MSCVTACSRRASPAFQGAERRERQTYMPALLAPLLLLALGVIAAAFWTLWGIPIAIIGIGVIIAMTVHARKKDPTVATWETGKGIEPTGTPRSSPGGAETTNERVGQS